MRLAKGFTLVELLVVVAIIALLVSIVVPTLRRAREVVRPALCQANLNGIGKALQLYYAENEDAFPMIRAHGDDPARGLALSHPDAEDDVHALAGTYPQDNLSLLVYTGMLGWDMFLCPVTSSTIKDRSGTGDDYGFGGGRPGDSYCDYGMQIPQHHVRGNEEHKAYLHPSAAAALVIMADRPPDSANLAKEFSPNHGNEGESILHFGGNVRWADDQQTTDPPYKNSCGWGNNNIYTKDMTAQDAVQAGAVTMPDATVSKYDSVLYWKSN